MMDSFSDSGSSMSSSSSSSSSHSFSDFSSSSHGSDSMFGASFEGGGGSSGGGGWGGSWGNDFSASSSSTEYHSGSRSSEDHSNWADLPGGQSDKAYGTPSSAESNWHSSTGQENLTSLPDTPGHIEGHVNPQDKYGYTVEYIPGERESIVFSDERLDGIDKPRGGSSGLDNYPEGSVHKGQPGAPEGLDRNGFFPSDNIRSDSGYGQPGGYEPTSGALAGNSFDLSRFDHTGIGPDQPIVDRPLGIVYDPNQTSDTVFKANSPSSGPDLVNTIHENAETIGVLQNLESLPKETVSHWIEGLDTSLLKNAELLGKLGPVPSLVELGSASIEYANAVYTDPDRAVDIATDQILNVASLVFDVIAPPLSIAADFGSVIDYGIDYLREASEPPDEKKGKKE